MGIKIDNEQIIDDMNSNIKMLQENNEAILISLNEIDQIVEADDIIGIEDVINENIDSLREFIAQDYYEMIEMVKEVVSEVTKNFEELDQKSGGKL